MNPEHYKSIHHHSLAISSHKRAARGRPLSTWVNFHDVASTLRRRCINVICPLGTDWFEQTTENAAYIKGINCLHLRYTFRQQTCRIYVFESNNIHILKQLTLQVFSARRAIVRCPISRVSTVHKRNRPRNQHLLYTEGFGDASE